MLNTEPRQNQKLFPSWIKVPKTAYQFYAIPSGMVIRLREGQSPERISRFTISREDGFDEQQPRTLFMRVRHNMPPTRIPLQIARKKKLVLAPNEQKDLLKMLYDSMPSEKSNGQKKAAKPFNGVIVHSPERLDIVRDGFLDLRTRTICILAPNDARKKKN